MTEKRISALISNFNYYIFGLLLACSFLIGINLYAQESSIIRIKVPSLPKSTNILGIGVQLDPFFHSNNIPMNNGAKEEDWERVIAKRVRSMRIERFRIGVFPEWWEPYNDDEDPETMKSEGFTWESEEMLSLYKVLDLAEKQGIDVNLVLWGCPKNFSLLEKGKLKYKGSHFLADDGNFWVTGPSDPREFAESFTALLCHLIQIKGYSCISEITPFNEPDGQVISAEGYVKCFKELDGYLKKYNLRQKVKMTASDNMSGSFSYLQKCANELYNEADMFCSHTYSFGYESKNLDVSKWEENNQYIISRSGKPHIIGEYGSNQCVGVSRQKDIDQYSRGVLLCRLAIDFLNAGAVSVCYWNLFDHFRSVASSYESMQQLGLWRYVNDVYQSESYYNKKTEDYYARPQYYAYSLLSRFIRKGDKAYPLSIDKDYLSGIVLQHRDSTWSYIFANGETQSYTIEITTIHNTKVRFGVYKYLENKLPKHAKQIKKSQSIRIKDNVLNVRIPANSVIVLSQRR